MANFFLLQKSATETRYSLREVYKTKCFSRTSFFEKFKSFQGHRKDIEDYVPR